MSTKKCRFAKYRIKSYNYEHVCGGRQLLFTIEEHGVGGEVRKTAGEIIADKTWLKKYNKQDIAKIAYAAAESIEPVE